MIAQRKKGIDDLFLSIRSFPFLKQGGHRYPVSYLEGGQLKVIAIPVGSLDCSTDCYTHTDSFKFRESVTIEKACPICKKSNKKNNNTQNFFIDIGLMMFIQKNQTIILNNKYGWANMDRDGRLIGWEVINNPLIDALSKYVSKNVIEGNSNVKLSNINYLNMKGVIREKFSGLYAELKESDSNRLLTWCRANLKVDQSFDGVIVNTSTNPNQFNYYKFLDELGSGVVFDGKHTHINYISHQNIFIIQCSNNTRKTIETFVADFTQGILDNHKLRVVEVASFVHEFRDWYSTCYDHKTNSLYLIGGEYQNKNNKGGIQRFTDIKWNGKTLSVRQENEKKDIFQNVFTVGRSLTASTMVNVYDPKEKQDADSLMVTGGLTIKDQTIKYTLLENLLSFTPKGEIMEKRQQGGNVENKVGAYTNLIEIPQVPGMERPGMLILAGNSDFRTDSDRHRFCNVYFWSYRQPMKTIVTGLKDNQQKDINFKCSNTNYPFLFESTGVLLKTQNNRFIVRTLIPARNSLNRNLKAYVLQYDILAERMTETPINLNNLT